MELSIIIPAYNEADRIVLTLNRTLDYLDACPYESEIIVVSDGSTDATLPVSRKMGNGRSTPLRAIEYHPNRGKGHAVRTGMQEGRGAVLMFMDADYSVPIEAVEKGRGLLQNGFDIAIGSRTLKASRILARQNWVRMLSARIYTLVQNRYLGIAFRDTQCGFKLFTQKAAHALFRRQKLNSVIFDPEILYLAKRMGFRTGEFPVDWRHMEDSRIQYDSLKKSLFVFQELFRIRRVHRIGSTSFSDI